MELRTWLRKIKLAFKLQHMQNQGDKLNVALQHLDGVVHTWGESWITKFPRGDFSDFVDA